MEKKDWRRIKERCLRAMQPSNEVTTRMQHRMNIRIAAYNYSVKDDPRSTQFEEREGR